MPDAVDIALTNVINLRQCALFVDSPPIKQAMVEAADWIEQVGIPAIMAEENRIGV
jgi:hypothetical protein